MANQLLSAKVPARVFGMDAFTPADLSPAHDGGDVLLFVVSSTFGEGERPDQSEPFWDYLAGLSADALNYVAYSCFGLGASKYGQNFCKVRRQVVAWQPAVHHPGRVSNNENHGRIACVGSVQAALDFDARLEAVGARRLVAVGMGDEQADDGFNTAFEPWLASVFDEIGVVPPPQAIVPHHRVVLALEESYPAPPPPRAMFATLLGKRLLSDPTYARPIYLLDFDIGATGYSYEVGDSLGVFPSNPVDHVERFLSWYHLNPNAVVSIVPVDETNARLPLPPSATVRTLFCEYLDLFARPGKVFFRQVWSRSRTPKCALFLSRPRHQRACTVVFTAGSVRIGR